MKYLYLAILSIITLGCSNKIKESLDPTQKTLSILNAILEQKHEQVKGEHFGISNSPENFEAVKEMDETILIGLKKFGMPQNSQIEIKMEKIATPKHFKSLINLDSIITCTVDTKMGLNREFKVQMKYIRIGENLKIIDMGTNTVTFD